MIAFELWLFWFGFLSIHCSLNLKVYTLQPILLFTVHRHQNTATQIPYSVQVRNTTNIARKWSGAAPVISLRSLCALNPKQQVDRWVFGRNGLTLAVGRCCSPPDWELPRPRLTCRVQICRWLVISAHLVVGAFLCYVMLFSFLFLFFKMIARNIISGEKRWSVFSRIVCIVFCTPYNRYLPYPWKHVKWAILIGSVASRCGVPRSPGEEKEKEEEK